MNNYNPQIQVILLLVSLDDISFKHCEFKINFHWLPLDHFYLWNISHPRVMLCHISITHHVLYEALCFKPLLPLYTY